MKALFEFYLKEKEALDNNLETLPNNTFKRLSFFLISVSFIGMFFFSKNKWTDPVVDFGRELYVPWALLQGDRLYSDIHYFNGPLSPYFNSAMFWLFGVGLDTLIYVNLFLSAVLVIQIWFILKNLASFYSSLFGCITFIYIFVFSQYTGIANYNYITPYSHETTHGILLSLTVFTCLVVSLKTKSWIPTMFAGIFLGLTFLTKPEFFIACFSLIIAYLIVVCLLRGSDFALKNCLLLVFFSIIPILTAFILLNAIIPFQEAINSIFYGYIQMTNHELINLQFYKIIMGTINIWQSLNGIFLGSLLFVLFLSIPVLASLTSLNNNLKCLFAILPGLAVAFYILQQPILALLKITQPFQLIIIVSGCYFLYHTYKKRTIEGGLMFMLCVFSLVLLFKMIFNVRFFHYGFVLAMPAAMTIVAVTTHWIPELIRNQGKNEKFFFGGMIIIIVLVIIGHINITANIYSYKVYPVASSRDFFLADKRGNEVNEVVNWFIQKTELEETMLVLPEGIIINYLSKRKNPTPIMNLMPVEMIMYGENRLLSNIKSKAPDYIVLVHKDTREYGYDFFGKGYGVAIMDWINSKYEAITTFGAVPLKDDKFGIMILKKKDK